MDDISRTITLRCPVCASTQFIFDEADPESPVECENCHSVFSRSDLQQQNDVQIQSAIDDAKDEVMEKIKNEFEKLFKK